VTEAAVREPAGLLLAVALVVDGALSWWLFGPVLGLAIAAVGWGATVVAFKKMRL
jgi:hypothetical protein